MFLNVFDLDSFIESHEIISTLKLFRTNTTEKNRTVLLSEWLPFFTNFKPCLQVGGVLNSKKSCASNQTVKIL
jgi:hypothetical protein